MDFGDNLLDFVLKFVKMDIKMLLMYVGRLIVDLDFQKIHNNLK